MPLESCMIVIDNSEFTRNGDYTPTRFQAQAQAVASVFTAKTDSNPESSVGLLTMAGKSPSLLVTPTNDIGKLLSALARAQIGGAADPITAIQIAQLALKHRENKNARQRVVVFAGSDLGASEEELVKLGKKLRKNNVLIDVVLFGDEGLEAEGRVAKLIEAAGGGDSHLVAVPPGPHLLSDVIQTSPILFDPERAPAEGAEGDMGDGLDPNMDPELAMAIRMSLQEAEEAARRSAPSADAGPSQANTAAPASSSSAAPTAAAALPAGITAPLSNANVSEPAAPGDAAMDGVAAAAGEDEDEDEDEMLRQAMALSRGEAGGGDVDMGDEGEAGAGDDEEDEEAAIARAIAMSLQEDKGGEEKK